LYPVSCKLSENTIDTATHGDFRESISAKTCI
jgi:hypothetical protein